MSEIVFEQRFIELTGRVPLRWQSRLFHDHFRSGDLCQVIDLPTGLGKTMVMAIWLIAREINSKLPRRLIYVVDRRTVVDQATTLAKKLRHKYGKDKLAISTLRGRMADDREWSKDPSHPAIIIGTVDLIGSSLLFSGYRSSFKRRPLTAGLLGQDSLILLDEAHLSKPFERLLESITAFQSGEGSPMRVIRMSATTAKSNNQSEGNDVSTFKLEVDDYQQEVIDVSGKASPDPVTERYKAPKRLTINTLGAKEKLSEGLVTAAIKLATDDERIGKRIVVFVRKPDDAIAIAKLICNHKSTKTMPGPHADAVEVLTGTMRGLERDELVKKPVFKARWLNGDIDPSDKSNESPVFLVSTSAGEVGLDLNADHMVCDAAPFDSMIQRLGRVNRRGKGHATIHLVRAEEPAEKSDIDRACIAASKLFTQGMDVSPKALAEFKSNLSGEQLQAASTPEPAMVDLTDILLDAWSMTTITTPMPGRPEVAPWIRGIADELPQTTIAWREELDLPGFDRLDLEDIAEWFDTHRVLTHESLSVPTNVAARWLTERWKKLSATQQSEVGPRSIIVDRAGLKLVTIKDLDKFLGKGGDNTAAIRNADLIVPASFGGIQRGKGMLDADAPELAQGEGKQSISPDVADEFGRFRQRKTKTEESAPVCEPIGSGTLPQTPSEFAKFVKFALDLEWDDDIRVQLISYIPKQEKPEFGAKGQSLSDHVGLVRAHMDGILKRLELPEAIQRAAELAADYHDHGKNRELWQRTVKGAETPSGPPWTKATLGKSGGEIKRDRRGYRHEFGSLREFIDADKQRAYKDSAGKDITCEVIELALHLIAAHHGRGRPHFPKGGFDPDAEARSSEIHTDVIRRFANLQRTYGHWRLAWLENLLRCADGLASGEQGSQVRTDSDGGQT